VNWLNHRRLDEACGDIRPAELDAAYCRRRSETADYLLPASWLVQSLSVCLGGSALHEYRPSCEQPGRRL